MAASHPGGRSCAIATGANPRDSYCNALFRITVRLFDTIHPDQLDRRELQLTLLACSTILVLGAGLALLMYPLVFSHSGIVLRNAFYGFCGLSALLAVYLVDRQVTILQLRREVAEAGKRAAETKIEASAELLNAIPNLGSFKDRLAMEYRRAAAANQILSVLVVTVLLPDEVCSTRLPSRCSAMRP